MACLVKLRAKTFIRDAKNVSRVTFQIENKEKGDTVEKTPEVSKRGHARVLNRSNSNLKRKQPESCSVSDQVANVKQSIQDTLNTIRHFKAELKTRENNLEASLLEVDDLGVFRNQYLLVFLDISNLLVY